MAVELLGTSLLFAFEIFDFVVPLDMLLEVTAGREFYLANWTNERSNLVMRPFMNNEICETTEIFSAQGSVIGVRDKCSFEVSWLLLHHTLKSTISLLFETLCFYHFGHI